MLNFPQRRLLVLPKGFAQSCSFWRLKALYSSAPSSFERTCSRRLLQLTDIAPQSLRNEAKSCENVSSGSPATDSYFPIMIVQLLVPAHSRSSCCSSVARVSKTLLAPAGEPLNKHHLIATWHSDMTHVQVSSGLIFVGYFWGTQMNMWRLLTHLVTLKTSHLKFKCYFN